ncbi:hypothetical protein BGE01nite_28860 [Brevifollis gellanilyticus]|uniref:Glycosyl hydrolase-like 10 domain-containing protein n=1 Tax=Brevifollis gellanilyticus TaxID=748831 RepID=A0A512MA32_9BACT|nr:hypothetical protein BGE01nite_28860 [Brevifollis gellanilyticus]
MLYSNDTTNITSCVSPFHAARQPLSQKMIEATVDEVTGLVDAHMLQPGLGMVPMWPSKVIPVKEHYAWIKERYGQKPDSFGQFVINGGDIVQIFIDRCRQQKQAAFISFRMNDAHHKEFSDPKPGVNPGSSIGMSVTRHYVEHPEYRIKPGSLRGTDLVQNWAVEEVRAQKFALIRELCENYDLDGLELDYLRFYSYFRLDETPLEKRQAIMTSFVRKVRELLDKTARDGRRRWLCARVPCHLTALDVLGLDLRGMVAAGLDMVNASDHYFTTQQHDLVAIREQTQGAALYFELCHTLWKGEKVTAGYDVFPYRRATKEHLQTSAHLAYARGADGISLFNFAYYRQHGQGEGRGTFGEPPFEALKELSDPKALAKQPQHWFIAFGWRAPGMKPPPVPRKVESGKPQKFNFDIAAPSGGWKQNLRLRIQSDQSLSDTEWQATFNGEPISPTNDASEPFAVPYPSLMGKPEELRVWTVPAKLMREGKNSAEFTSKAGKTVSITFVDLA